MADERLPVDLANRVTLRPKEAAAVLGVSDRKLRAMLPRLPHFRDGEIVLIPVDALREWARDKAKAAERRASLDANEIERQLRSYDK